MADHPLGDFRLKLNRATAHLETLERDIDAWFDRHPYGVTGRYEAGPPEQYVLYLRFFEPPPVAWGLLIGEFAHNARSALDYLAWRLVKANNHKPDHRTQFPIVLTPWEWHGPNGAARLHGASARHIAMVERMQPYGGPDDEGFYHYSPLHRVFEQPLATLRFLSNEDKHRVLLVTAAALQSIGWDVIATHDVAPITDLGQPYFGPLTEGSPLLEIPVQATGPDPTVEVSFVERARIAIEHRINCGRTRQISSRIDLLEVLAATTAELRRIFRLFVREFL